MTGERLLTKNQIRRVWRDSWGELDTDAELDEEEYKVLVDIAKAQDVATLKAVGERLEQLSKEAGDLREFERTMTEAISALKERRMP